MKTLLITSFHPVVLRNLLMTEALSLLMARTDVRVVVLVPGYKKEYFAAQLQYPNLIVEGITLGSPSKQFVTLIIKRLAKLSIDTASAKIQRRMKWEREGKWWYYAAAAVPAWLSRHGWYRAALRYADRVLTATNRYEELFNTYAPDLVLVTDVQNERDVEVSQYAKRRGIRTYALVRNWDNLTSHGLIRSVPDVLLVGSGELRRQAIHLNGLRQERVRLVGNPHHDRWVKGSPQSREAFFAEHGFDQKKPLILLALIGDWYIPDNDTDAYLLELAATWDANVMVRFHPTVEVAALRDAKPAPNMAFDRPGQAFSSEYADRVLDTKDDERLMCELSYSDMVVCGPTTLGMEAMLFGKPVALINFHRRSRSLKEGIVLYEYDHLRFVRQYRAAWLTESAEELGRAITTYLKNPELHAEGRAVVANAYGGPQDGRSGKRLAQELLDGLGLLT